jgi:hypothetical protein
MEADANKLLTEENVTNLKNQMGFERVTLDAAVQEVG